MKKIISIILLLQASRFIAIAQQKSFEGTIVYKTEAKSKDPATSDRVLKKMFAMGDSTIVNIKNGNYRQTNELSDEYYIARDKKVYLKFKGIDTLYYLDYTSDTSTVLGISKAGEEKQVAGYTCKPITITLTNETKKYYYSPSLYLDPAPDLDNRIGRYDVFAKETSSLYLALYNESKSFSISNVCTRIKPEPIDDTIFGLPSLPEKKFSMDAILIPPEYKLSGGWLPYLQMHLNADLGAKYVKIPKGEKTGEQVVMVKFVINETGRITDVEVLNKNEVHSKLAEEAVRVISESPAWRPATVFGEKIKYWIKQPVTFIVNKQ